VEQGPSKRILAVLLLNLLAHSTVIIAQTFIHTPIKLQVYVDGLLLYDLPTFRGAGLLSVTLDTSVPLDGSSTSGVHFSPSLSSLAARLLESVKLAMDEVNGLPRLKVGRVLRGS